MARRQSTAPRCGAFLAFFLVAACGTDPAANPTAVTGAPGAEATPASPERINGLVDAYLLAGGKQGYLRSHKDHCPQWPEPDAQGCAEAACQRMDSWDCDDQSEVLALLQACKGNYGGACLNAACSRMDTWDCDDASEVIPIAKACKGVLDSDCISTVCDLMDTWDCDDGSEVLPVIAACDAGVDGDCLSFVCSQLDPWECDDWSEIKPILASCEGDDHP